MGIAAAAAAVEPPSSRVVKTVAGVGGVCSGIGRRRVLADDGGGRRGTIHPGTAHASRNRDTADVRPPTHTHAPAPPHTVTTPQTHTGCTRAPVTYAVFRHNFR